MKKPFAGFPGALALSAALVLALGGCAGGGGSSSPGASGGAGSAGIEAVTAEITLQGDSIQVSGPGVTARGNTATITAAGVYRVSGTLADGQLTVEAGKDDTVTLLLDGASLSSSDSAPIYAKKAGLTVITLAEGSENFVSDGAVYAYAQGEDEPDAAIFAKDSLTIGGSGSLTVAGNFNNGVGSKDHLTVEGGTLAVTAANDGLRGRDSLTVSGGTLEVRAAGDGLKSNNDEDPEKGFVALLGGSLAIEAGNDGVQAETSLTVEGGSVTITAGGGAGADPADPEGSYKGLKAGTALTVTGGTFDLDTADDAVHANGDVTIAGGTFTLATGDDGVHADGALLISGGSIRITQSYEGLEGTTVTVTGGEVDLTATDDGVNAAGGSDGGAGGPMGADSFRSGGERYIEISGGFVAVDAQGDGLDANGDLRVSGGVVLVNGPTGGGDGALDYDGKGEISGGVLLAVGSSQMAQGITGTGDSAALMVYYSAPQAAGTLLSLTDGQGNLVAAFAPAKSYQCAVVSAPGLAVGGAYTLSAGGTCDGEARNGYYSAGAVTGAQKLCEITLSGPLTSVSDTGEAVSGRGGMGGGPGGMGGMGGGPAGPGAPGGRGNRGA